MNPTASADLSAGVWRKSTRSAGGGSNCVQIAHLSGFIAIRDSKNPHGATLILGCAAFQHLTDRLKHDTLNI
jgi:hypothetical protein